MKAVVVEESKKASIQDIPEPKLRPDYVKVKTLAVALNPTDWKHIDFIADKGAVVGCDFAGTVTEVGNAVKSNVKVGDTIAGLVHGSNLSNHEDGAFAEYLVVKDGVFFKVPKNLSVEEAATLGVGVSTVGQGLFQSLKTPLPDQKPAGYPILIYGGSTATGALAIQYAKLSGHTVVTTASAHNHAYVKELGADHVFDYKSPTCGEDIRKVTNNQLRHVFDTIALEGSAKICSEALSSDASQPLEYSSLLPVKNFPRSDVNSRFTMAYTAMGEKYTKRGKETIPPEEDYPFAVHFWSLSEPLFAQGKVKVHKPEVGKNGLQGVLEGLDLLRNDKVSGVKLVYRVADTPGL